MSDYVRGDQLSTDTPIDIDPDNVVPDDIGDGYEISEWTGQTEASGTRMPNTIRMSDDD